MTCNGHLMLLFAQVSHSSVAGKHIYYIFLHWNWQPIAPFSISLSLSLVSRGEKWPNTLSPPSEWSMNCTFPSRATDRWYLVSQFYVQGYQSTLNVTGTSKCSGYSSSSSFDWSYKNVIMRCWIQGSVLNSHHDIHGYKICHINFSLDLLSSWPLAAFQHFQIDMDDNDGDDELAMGDRVIIKSLVPIILLHFWNPLSGIEISILFAL